MTDSRVTPQAVQAAALAIAERVSIPQLAHWYRGDAEAALAAAVPLLCQPLQDEIDRLRAQIKEALDIIGLDGCYCEGDPDDACTNHLIEAAFRAAVPVGTGNPTDERENNE